MPYEFFLDGLDLILSNCFFTFNSQIYKQIFGSPMGYPSVSPVLANLVMEYVENNVGTQHARLQAPILLPLCR
jgi:hypothetical protein